MKMSKYQIANRKKLIRKAIKLYKQGLTTREVGKIVNRSHNWVAMMVKEFSTGLDL